MQVGEEYSIEKGFEMLRDVVGATLSKMREEAHTKLAAEFGLGVGVDFRFPTMERDQESPKKRED